MDVAASRLSIKLDAIIEQAQAENLAKLAEDTDHELALEDQKRKELNIEAWRAFEQRHAWAILLQGEITAASDTESVGVPTLSTSTINVLHALAEVRSHEGHWIHTALEHNRVPHPGDVARVLQFLDIKSTWTVELVHMGRRLDRFAKSCRGAHHQGAAIRYTIIKKTTQILEKLVRALGPRDRFIMDADRFVADLVNSTPWNKGKVTVN
jgi:hypothetical protein